MGVFAESVGLDATGLTDGVMEDGEHSTSVLGADIIAKQPSEKVQILVNHMVQKEADTLEKIHNFQKLSKPSERRG
jgi:hypothetical protein